MCKFILGLVLGVILMVSGGVYTVYVGLNYLEQKLEQQEIKS